MTQPNRQQSTHLQQIYSTSNPAKKSAIRHLQDKFHQIQKTNQLQVHERTDSVGKYDFNRVNLSKNLAKVKLNKISEYRPHPDRPLPQSMAHFSQTLNHANIQP
jgi:hypothetical protein